MTSQRICHKSDLPKQGEMKVFRLNFKPITLYNIDDKFYALADYCTHEEAALSEVGFVDGDEVECSLHGARFHIPTGKVRCLPAVAALESYSVTIEDEDVIIHL